jgi:hypothetical protein
VRLSCNPCTELAGKMPHLSAPLWLASVAWACSSAGPNAARAPQHAERRHEQVDRTIVTSTEALTAFELLVRGKQHLARGAYEDAKNDLDRVVAQDPTGPWLEEALYFGAHAREGAGDLNGAAARFARVGEEFKRSGHARDARLRALRLYVYTEQWSLAGSSAATFMALYTRRVPREELVVRGAAALALLEGEAVTQALQQSAAAHITEARRVIAQYNLDGAGHIPRDLAQVYFAWGELKRLEGEELTFNPLPEDFADHFERRAQLLLDAQRAYSDVMRAYDSHWTAMAGYRVAELYQRLHQDIVQAPRPVGADTERRKLVFEAAVRLRYTILLEKGLHMIEHTLTMADRTGEKSAWVDRARAARHQLLEAYGQEKRAIDASPYSKEDLERTLAELQSRKP